MTRKRIFGSLASGVAMLVVSFMLTNVAYTWCEDWFNPGSRSMSAFGGVILGLVVAPMCALVTAGLVLKWPDRKKRS